MKKIALLFCLFFAFSASAQQVKYRIISDDPKNLKAFSLSLEPFYADLSAPDIH